MSTGEPNGWLSKNALRAYPFKENTNFQLTLAGVPIGFLPTNIFVDLMVVTNTRLNDETTAICLTKIKIVGTTVTFTFSEVDLPFSEEVAAAIVNTSTYTTFSAVKLTSIRTGTTGVAVFGEGLGLFVATLGSGTFRTGDVGFIVEEKATRSNPFYRVLTISELGNPDTTLVGDIKLEGGYNIELTRNDNHNSIIVSAYVGAGKGQYCGETCPEPENCEGAVYTINGVGPDKNGNLGIYGEKFVTITPGTNRITIGTTIDVDNLCYRSGTPGNAGPDGPAGPAGGGGFTPPLDCTPCPGDCSGCPQSTEPCDDELGGVPGPGNGLEITESPC